MMELLRKNGDDSCDDDTNDCDNHQQSAKNNDEHCVDHPIATNKEKKQHETNQTIIMLLWMKHYIHRTTLDKSS